MNYREKLSSNFLNAIYYFSTLIFIVQYLFTEKRSKEVERKTSTKKDVGESLIYTVYYI